MSPLRSGGGARDPRPRPHAPNPARPPRAARAPRPAATREDPTGLAPLVSRIDEWVQATRCFPALERDRDSLEALLEQIQDRQASLETPLRILLLGGTGVGKSTLFNALAGDDLARAAAVRPTTRELTVYFHEANGTGSLGHLEAKAKLVAHDRPLLRDKIVIDAPDFDSTAQENRRLLEQALEVTDLALCVVTAEKYLSSELFELIDRHRQGIEFVFVLNKLDRAGDGALIVDDLQGELERHGLHAPRILAVSAAAVREAQRAAEAEGLSTIDLDGLSRSRVGQWLDLRSLLEQELDRVRIREIKAAKLADRVRALLARVEERVPEDVPRRIETWRATWAAALRDLTGDLSRSFFGAIHDDYELRNVLRYLFGTGFPGMFGVFMTLVYGLRSVLMPGYSRARRLTSADLDALLGERLRVVEIEHIERRVEVVLERFEHEGRRLGFHPDAAPEVPGQPRFLAAPLPQGLSSLVLAVRNQASRRFYSICEESSGRQGQRAGRLVWNLLPLLVVGLTAYAFLFSLLPSKLDGLGPSAVAETLKGTIPLLEGGLITLVVAFLIQWPLAERVIQRRIHTSLGLLEGVVEEAVDGCLGHAVVTEPEQVLAAILERHREFQHLRDDAHRVLRDETSQRQRRDAIEAAASAAEPDAQGSRRPSVRA